MTDREMLRRVLDLAAWRALARARRQPRLTWPLGAHPDSERPTITPARRRTGRR